MAHFSKKSKKKENRHHYFSKIAQSGHTVDKLLSVCIDDYMVYLLCGWIRSTDLMTVNIWSLPKRNFYL